MFSYILLFTITLAVAIHSNLLQKEERIKCKCEEAGRCQEWLAAVKSGKYLDLPVCGFNSASLNPLLCCPQKDKIWEKIHYRTKREIQNLQGLDNIQLSCKITSTQAFSPVQKAKQKCAEYAKHIFQSLFEVSVGDEPFKKEEVDTCVRGADKDAANSREFPHMALIGFGENKKWVCAGSLISERFILSVAHCSAIGRHHGNSMWANLGELDTSTDTDIARPQIYKIIEEIVHPEYNESTVYNDITLYKLEKEIDFTIFVRPACLYTKRDPPENFVEVTGWGQSQLFGPRTAHMKKIKMTIVHKEECSRVFNYTTELPYGIRHDSMVCTMEAKHKGPKICLGDSGNPLKVSLKTPYCMFGLYGLTSYGKICDFDTPVVNTRVSYYIPWIVKNVWPDDE